MPKNAVVYIDGFNLYNGIMDKGWSQYRWLDVGSLSEEICPKGYQIKLIRYFTSIVKGDVGKHQRQQVYLNALKAHLGSKYREMYGRFQLFPSHCKYCDTSPIFCSNCGKEYSKPNEKKTDVNIATSMLIDCFENNTDAIILISGDSDFERPLDEIGRLFPTVLREIAFPPKRRNPKLIGFCDQNFTIDISHFRNAGLLPNPVINPKNNKEYHKPSTW